MMKYPVPVIVSTIIFLAHDVYDEVKPSKFEGLFTPPLSTSFYSSSTEPPIQDPPSSSFMSPVAQPPVVTDWLLFQTSTYC